MKKNYLTLIFSALILTTALLPFWARAVQSTFEISQVVTDDSTTSTPTPSSSGGGSVSGALLLFLQKFTINPDYYSAHIEAETNVATIAKTEWGQTPDYELGSIISPTFTTNHQIEISDLAPATRYYFKITFTDSVGRILVAANQFTTLRFSEGLENILNFKATPSEKEITLTWHNPQTDFDVIRIVRSEKFYPKDPDDGIVIYEGRTEKFIDKDVEKRKIYYYTAFTNDREGNYSSGAITKGRLLEKGEIPLVGDIYGDVPLIPEGEINPLIKKLKLTDFDFMQDGVKLQVLKDKILIQGNKRLKISLDYGKVPEILKTIALTLRHADDPNKTFSFLLRVNEDKTAYEALLAPIGEAGEFQLGISILDHKNRGLQKLSGALVAIMPQIFFKPNVNGFLGDDRFVFLYALLLILATGAVYLAVKMFKNSNYKVGNRQNFRKI